MWGRSEEARTFEQPFAPLPDADAPCAAFRVAEVLLDVGFMIEGADLSMEMLEIAAARLKSRCEQFKAIARS